MIPDHASMGSVRGTHPTGRMNSLLSLELKRRKNYGKCGQEATKEDEKTQT
jgi:hypothetical protein